MKRILTLICTVGLLLGSVHQSWSQTTVINPMKVYPMIETPNAMVGEKLTFQIRFGMINGGKASIELKRDTLNGQKCWHSQLIGQTSGIAETFFRVYDVYESWFDSTNMVPSYAVRNIQEGKYRYYDEITYHPGETHVTSKKHKEVEVPTKVFDMACVAYYARMVDFNRLQKNDVINIDTYFGGDYFPFQLIYRGKEVVKTSLGSFNCIRIGPIVEPGRVFENNDDMMIWFTDDKNMLPVRIQFDVWAGSFKCDLISIENIKYPITSRIK